MYPTHRMLPSHFAYLPSLDAAPFATLVLAGAEHCVLFANQFCKRLLGHPVVIGEGLFRSSPKLAKSQFARLVDQVYANGQPVFESNVRLVAELDLSALFAQGQLDLSLVPWTDEAGALAGVFVIAIGRNTEAEATRRAQHSEEKLQALIDSLPHAVFVSDKLGRVLFANRLWQRYCGVSAEKMDLERWYKIVHPDDAVLMDAQWQRRFEQNRFEVCARLRDHESGTYRWQHIVGHPIERDPQRTDNWIGTWTDLTNRVQAEEHQNELRQRFVSTLSHDLRGPLTAIRANAESIMRHQQDSKLCSRLERIVRTVERTNEMLENLLDINLLHHDGLPRAEFASTDLIAAMQLSLANFHATFDGRLRTQLPTSVVGVWHAPTLVRAIDNMVGNAFKYGDENTPVTLRVRVQERFVEIDIHNEGRVLSEAEQQRIFAPYERLDDEHASSAPRRGWGLGLSFVADAARAHGGGVTVSSAPGKGTRFELRVPLQTSVHAQGMVPTHAAARAPATPLAADGEQRPFGPERP